MKKGYIFIAAGALLCAAVTAWHFTAQKKNTVGTKPLRVAVLLPLTGPAASTGDGSKKGFELAAEELRRQGANLSIEYFDTENSPKTAISIYQKLMASSPPDVIIPEMSGVTAALKPVLSGKSLAVATCVADPSLSDARDQTKLFRVFLGADGMGETAAAYITRSGAKATAVVYINDDYGRACLNSFKQKYLTSSQYSVVEESFGLMDKDFRTSWVKLLQTKPDAIFVCGYGPGYFAVLNQLRDTEYAGLIVTDWSLTDPGYMKATSGVRNGTKVIAVGWSPEFESSYKTRYGQTGSFVLSGYSYAVLQLLWKAHSMSDGSIDDLTIKFAALRGINTVMGNIDILPSGGVSAKYSIFTVHDLNLVRENPLSASTP